MMKLLGLGSVVGCISLAALWAPNALAQDSTTQQLAKCAIIENPLQRLVCYDKVAAGEAPVERSAGQSAARSPAASPEQEFGREHREDPTDNRPDKIFVELADVQRNYYGKWEITLKNGQQWEQVDSRTTPLPLDGDYYIERGVFNSFFLGRVGENRRIRVRRVDE